ncbi:iron chaperone [Parafilimonas sp.]|uniref:iron chaperone n=1 Tax=Parafilimonas sp. TaxID=1969739 RepID=UPI003F7D395B
MTVANNTDEYISAFPNNVQKLLKQMRSTIKKAAPQAAETISYGIPTFTLNGNLVHFAGYKNHIGFYPAPSGIEAFKKELSVYAGAKGSVQFPLDKPLPLELITKIVAFRVAENMEKALRKAGRQSTKKTAAAETGKSKKNKGFASE